MTVVASWDFVNRRIHMGVADWHPVDIYREYRAYRAANESCRKYFPLLSYQGNLPKGGGKFTSRYMVLLDGTKIIPMDGGPAPITNITGEVITDDQTEPLTYTGLSVRPMVNYAPPAAEVIQVSTSGGSSITLSQISDAVWTRAIGNLTLEQLQKYMGAVLLGTTTGIGTTTETFNMPALGSSVVSNNDGTNRTNVTLNG